MCALGRQTASARLVKSAGLLSAYPDQRRSMPTVLPTAQQSLPFYRMIEMPSESGITICNILYSHRERSIMRIRGHRTVLMVQDGTYLTFSTHPGCDGLELTAKLVDGGGQLGCRTSSGF